MLPLFYCFHNSMSCQNIFTNSILRGRWKANRIYGCIRRLFESTDRSLFCNYCCYSEPHDTVSFGIIHMLGVIVFQLGITLNKVLFYQCCRYCCCHCTILNIFFLDRGNITPTVEYRRSSHNCVCILFWFHKAIVAGNTIWDRKYQLPNIELCKRLTDVSYTLQRCRYDWILEYLWIICLYVKAFAVMTIICGLTWCYFNSGCRITWFVLLIYLYEYYRTSNYSSFKS